MSMNIWCRWVLSGRNGDEPFSIRVDITRSVSNTGTDNTASVNGTSPTLGSTKAATRDRIAGWRSRRRHDGAHDQRPAVADEHLRGFYQKHCAGRRESGPDRNYRQDRHHLFAGEMEKYAEDGTGHDTIARRKTVYAIHQVDGVDNANGGKNSQRARHTRRDRPDAPQTAEVVYAIAADKDSSSTTTISIKTAGKGKGSEYRPSCRYRASPSWP